MEKYNFVVAASGECDFNRIQDAINASSDGDRILIKNGIYNERVNINKSVEITGQCDDNGRGPVISIESGILCSVSSDAKISNISFENSNCEEVEKELRGRHSMVEVSSNAVFCNCNFYGSFDGNIKVMGGRNHPEFYKCDIACAKRNGVFLVDGTEALFKDCIIHDNGFHGFCISDSNPHVENCEVCSFNVENNNISGIKIDGESSGEYKNVTVHDITGAGFVVRNNSSPLISDCEIYNIKGDKGAVFGIIVIDGGRGVYENCKIHNIAGTGVGVLVEEKPEFVNIDIYDVEGEPVIYDFAENDCGDSCDYEDDDIDDFADYIEDEDEKEDVYYDDNIDNFEIKNGVLIHYNGNHPYVKIPEGVTEIGEKAFCFSSFSDNKIEKVIIPESVTKLGDSAFYECKELTSIKMSDNVREIGKYCFYDCYNLSHIKLPRNLQIINEYAFANCNLQKIIIPENVIKIGKSAFDGCYSRIFHIPESLAEFDGSSIYTCSIEKLTADKNNHNFTVVNGNLFSKDKSIFYYMNDKDSDEFIVPEGVTEIGNNAFSHNHLTYVNLPSTLKKIGDGAFELTEIEGINLPESLEYIGSGAFASTPLEEIYIPENVLSIKSYTFSGCTSLSNVIIPENLTTIEESAFESCYNLKDIKLPEKLQNLERNAFLNSGITNVELPCSLHKLTENSIFLEKDNE